MEKKEKIQDVIRRRHIEHYRSIIKDIGKNGAMAGLQAAHCIILNLDDDFIQENLIGVWNEYLMQIFDEDHQIAIKQAEYSARSAQPMSKFQLYAEGKFSYLKQFEKIQSEGEVINV